MSVRILAEGDFTVRAAAASELAERIACRRAEIDEIWEMGVAESQGRLFNGRLLHFVSATPRQGVVDIQGFFVDYKAFWANRREPSLALDIQPVGVSGLTITQDGWIMLARRSASVTQYPGRLELLPSGGIDDAHLANGGAIDHHAALLQELAEEAGVASRLCDFVQDLALIEDEDEPVVDLCSVIALTIDRRTAASAFPRNAEYEEPLFMRPWELADFAASREPAVVPTTMALLRNIQERRDGGTLGSLDKLFSFS
ncbi:MAG: hypothetical protein PWQ57_260 [Desulfovibrionales bacterium]|nr:hypothetical protein [Desulfovibrionales bacterium]